MKEKNKIRNRQRKQFSTGYAISGVWNYLGLYGTQGRQTVAYNKSKWFREEENQEAPAIITTKPAPRKMILVKKIAAQEKEGRSMIVRSVFYRPDEKYRGWFDETQTPRRLSPWKKRYGERRNTKRRPLLRKLSPAVDALIFGNLRTVTEDKIAA